MFDFGFFEGVLILFLLIIVIKPEDIPKVFHKLGSLYSQCLRVFYQIQNEFEELASINKKEK
ncbi:hypothetical protein DID80_03700 [Candidatus Marinamargulisbacteria bacterium SCGC AAA071-K20]|nr:hypothetical protein DID80_03700 [Candidatus Marinamargulisbacteria bacterium SCGC AAA071-K20]